MKHNILRRLGALVLTLSLAASLLPLTARPAFAAGELQVTLLADKKTVTKDETVKYTATVSNFSAYQDAKSYEYQWDALDSVGNPLDEKDPDQPSRTLYFEKAATANSRTGQATLRVKDMYPALGVEKVRVTVTAKDANGAVLATGTADCELLYVSITLDRGTLSLTKSEKDGGQTGYLPTTGFPARLPQGVAVNWRSSNTSVVTVSAQGFYRAHSEGKAEVTATLEGRTLLIREVTVTDLDVFTAKVVPETVTLDIGEVFQLDKEVRAPAGSTPTYAWKSGRTAVATVSDTGWVEAKARGDTEITLTVTATNSKNQTVRKTATCTVRVGDSSISVTGLTVTPQTLTLSEGSTSTLTAGIQPAAAKDTPVLWVSDRPDIASVDLNGKVTGMAPGTAVITATAGTQEAKCTVTVAATATGIKFNDKSEHVFYDSKHEGKLTLQFNYNGERSKPVYILLEPSTAANTRIEWSFTDGDKSIATVQPNASTLGADVSLSSVRTAGRATLTATAHDKTTGEVLKDSTGEDLTAELEVVVSGLTLSESAVTMYIGQAKTVSIEGTYGEIESTGSYGDVRWRSTDDSIVSVENGSLSANNRGTATVTVTKGSYSAACVVTVVEDPDLIVNAGTATAGNPIVLGSSAVISRFNQVARKYTGGNMESISSIFVTPAQGVVYNNHRSEADTGAGVAMSEKYTVNGTGPESIQALSFVPNRSFTGEARISYIGTSLGQTISGVITVNVKEMSDVTYTANGTPVPFLTDDFNAICVGRTGSNLKYVTFTQPDAGVGTLYYNYTNETHPGEKVVSSTQYNRTNNPKLSDVTFVPAPGYSGTARITYRAMNTSNASYTGTVIVNVTAAGSTSDPGDIYYTAPQGGWAALRAQDFNSASLRVIGESLSHVRFSLPSSSEGTLFYNYRSFGDYDSAVLATTDYKLSGAPSLSGVAFVPATTSSGKAAITYTGYGTRGSTFTGTVYVSEGSGYVQNGSSGELYSVTVGAAVNLSANSFNDDCVAATGAELSYIRFSSLPSAAQGVLYYDYRPSISSNTPASTYTSYYRAGSSGATNIIDKISFLASRDYIGTVTIPYVGYNTSNGTFTGSVTIEVTPNTITCTGTTASPIRLSASQMRATLTGLMSHEPSYIVFTSLPDASAGRLYTGYTGYGTGSQVSTGVKYYISSNPNIDQISFLARGRYTGNAVARYTAYSASGEQVSGQIIFYIVAPSGSSYFGDLYGYGWAASSVDYLYENSVVKGMTATTFGPSQQILRRDFVLMLYRAFQFSGGNASKPGFADVPANSYYAQAVSAAKQKGIVNGDGVNFMPANQITRQDAMVMIVNAMKAAGKLQGTASTAILNNYPDGASVSPYAREAVSTLIQMGAVNGSNGYLNPRSPITRAEAAVILHFVMTA